MRSDIKIKQDDGGFLFGHVYDNTLGLIPFSKGWSI
jgi:hypothetical protein